MGGDSGRGAHEVLQAALVSEWEEEEVGCVQGGGSVCEWGVRLGCRDVGGMVGCNCMCISAL